MKQFVLFFISLFLLGVGARSQEMYQKKVFISSRGDSLNYRLLRPEVEKTGLQYPLVLFLHGAGERGSDNEKQLTHGGQMFLNPGEVSGICPCTSMSRKRLLGVYLPSLFLYSFGDAGRTRDHSCTACSKRVVGYLS